MKIQRRRSLYIKQAGKKGRGIFTTKPIPANKIIEVAPVIVFSPADRKHIEKSKLFDYIFAWGNDEKQGAMALGYVSLYNHASPSNCDYMMDYDKEIIILKSMRPIKAGEELTINYMGSWDDKTPVWFETK
ncbi:MAG TPA: SET domain-containing protein [Phnomibacter sp.]|nr:SET domain-containing protein [Phnomibacter sp.]